METEFPSCFMLVFSLAIIIVCDNEMQEIPCFCGDLSDFLPGYT